MAVNNKDVKAIVDAIGGKENLDTATHCVTRLRLVLKDDNKVDKDALSDKAKINFCGDIIRRQIYSFYS